MRCKGCTLPLDSNDSKTVPYGDDWYHADCWCKKLTAIGASPRQIDGLHRSTAEERRVALKREFGEEDDE